MANEKELSEQELPAEDRQNLTDESLSLDDLDAVAGGLSPIDGNTFAGERSHGMPGKKATGFSYR